MKKDRIFANEQEPIQPFTFNRKVARVFDDMLIRSVPLYEQGICLQAELVRKFYQPGTRIYDLGCSHGNLGMTLLEDSVKDDFTLIAIDNSLPMIEAYKKRLEKSNINNSKIHLICTGMEDVRIQNASVVIINLTLQFLDPGKREELINNIYKGLLPQGILLLTEKTSPDHGITGQIYQNFYEQFKKDNGYSDLEIARKREALEKVLIPETTETHLQRLSKAGFPIADMWMKWFYFTSFLAIKTKSPIIKKPSNFAP